MWLVCSIQLDKDKIKINRIIILLKKIWKIIFALIENIESQVKFVRKEN
jgi:hypothetical protein